MRISYVIGLMAGIVFTLAASTHVDLVREIPEAMKPRSIPIASSSKLLEVEPTKVAA